MHQIVTLWRSRVRELWIQTPEKMSTAWSWPLTFQLCNQLSIYGSVWRSIFMQINVSIFPSSFWTTLAVYVCCAVSEILNTLWWWRTTDLPVYRFMFFREARLRLHDPAWSRSAASQSTTNPDGRNATNRWHRFHLSLQIYLMHVCAVHVYRSVSAAIRM